MMDGLPKSVRVGPHDIKFGMMDRSDAEKNFGLFEHGIMTISLADIYPSGSVAVDIVLHEITHALMTFAGVKDEAQEQFCQLIGCGFAQIVRDNPELIAWMQETVKK